VSILAVKRRRDLRRQRWQFLAVLATIVLGAFTWATSYDAYRNLSSSYNGTYERLGFASMTVTGADTGFAEAVAGIDGVAAVRERRQADVPFRIGDTTLIGRVVGMPPDEMPPVDAVDIENGSYLSSARPDGVLVETHAAGQFDLAVGDHFDVYDGTAWRTVEVLGIAVSPEYIWPARSRQEIFPAPGSFAVAFVDGSLLDTAPAAAVADQTLVRYAKGAETDKLDTRVADLARSFHAESAIPMAEHPSNETLQLDVSGFQQVSVLFPALFLLAAGMTAFVLLTRLVYEQRGQIGTLRANGMSRGTLRRHYLSYGLLLGGIGGIIGTAVGMLGGWAMTGVYTSELGIPDTVRTFHLLTPVVGIVFGFVAGAVGAWGPARVVTRLAPAEAIRGDVTVSDGKLSLVERLIPLVRRLPVRSRMVFRGVRRNPRRSLSTILGVVLGLVVILPSWGMIDTMQLLLHRQFVDIQVADATVVSAMPVGDAQVQAVRGVVGVAAAEPVITLDATLRSPEADYATRLSAFEQGTEVHGFPDLPDGLPTGGLVAGRAVADKIGVAVGDEVIVSFPTLGTEIAEPIVAFVDEPLGTFVYTDRTALIDALAEANPAVDAATLASPAVTTVAAVFDGSSPRDDVLSRLRDLPQVATVIDAKSLFEMINAYMGFFWVFVGLMVFLGGAMALAVVFSAISVNVVERASEYATMRANGMSRRQVAGIITGENMLLTALGIVPGLILGYWAAIVLMHTYTSDLLSFDLRMRPMTPIIAALAMFVVAAVSMWPGIRAIGKVDVAEVVRERSL